MERFFKLKENGTTVRTEIVAGLTTFFTMAYIIFVNPELLGFTGMDKGAVMIATCLAAALGTYLIGILSNYPFAQAPGMGLNAFFAFTICGSMGYSWQAALAAVFVSGILFIAITATGFRQMIVNAIPMSLKRAIGAGIGLFIALIGLTNAGIVVGGAGTVVELGDFGSPTVLLAVFGLFLALVLLVKKVKGSLFIAIVGTSAVGAILQFGLGVELGISASGINEAFGESFSAFGNTFGQAFSGFGELFSAGEGFGVMIASVLTVLIALTLTDMFDTIGTLIGTAEKGGFLDKEGNLPRAGGAMMADAIATTTGAVLGTSTVTTYVESAAGISEGGRTGLTSMVTGTLFLLSLIFAPMLGLIPSAATAPILIVVGVLMVASLKNIKWDDLTEAIPCFFTVVMMPFAYSISDGIGMGFIFYALVKLFTGKAKEIHPVLGIFALVFIARYVLMGVGLI